MSPDLQIVSLQKVHIGTEPDIVACRQHARHFAAALGFDLQSQTRIATAVSEIARNAYQYASGGDAEFIAETYPNNPAHAGSPGQQSLVIVIRDQGKGIEQLETILAGQYRSPTGMGLGLIGARRLMDGVE